MTSKDLLSAVDQFYWLEEMKADLEYKGGGNAARGQRYQDELFSKLKI